MPCTKRELVEAINSFASARATGDGNLITMSAQLVQAAVDSLEFAPEPEAKEESEAASEWVDPDESINDYLNLNNTN